MYKGCRGERNEEHERLCERERVDFLCMCAKVTFRPGGSTVA